MGSAGCRHRVVGRVRAERGRSSFVATILALACGESAGLENRIISNAERALLRLVTQRDRGRRAQIAVGNYSFLVTFPRSFRGPSRIASCRATSASSSSNCSVESFRTSLARVSGACCTLTSRCWSIVSFGLPIS